MAHDLDLVEQARDGSQDAVVELWVRHYPAALSAARRTARQARDAEELASDAFSNMLGAFATGGGPTGSVRAYLLTSVRNLAITRSRRASSSEVLSEDIAAFEDGARSTPDLMSRQTEISMMRQAFAALPRRWQVILWRTAVDHDRNIEIGQDLGISANAVAALAKRARRGLRQAYLQVHLSTNGLDPACEPFVRRLPTLAVDGAAPTDELARHLETCRTCPGRLAELQRVEQQLGSMLLPAVLLTAPGLVTPALAAGTVATGTATTGTTTATTGTATTGIATTGTAAGGAGSGSSTPTLVAKLGVGKLAAATTAVGAAAAVSAVLLVPSDHEPAGPPAGQVTPSTTPPGTTSSQSPSSTTTTPPRRRPTDSPTRPPTSPTSPRSSPSHPVTKPPPHRSTTTRPSSPGTTATPLRVGMSISGPPDTTTIGVEATTGASTRTMQLTMQVPVGVTLRSASGDWRSCTQRGQVITCTARSTTGRWAGSIVTDWQPDASGTVTVQVRTAEGSEAQGSAAASASWPPGSSQ